MTWAALVTFARGAWGKFAVAAGIVGTILLALWRLRATAREAGRQEIRQEQQAQAAENAETRRNVEDGVRADSPVNRRDRLRRWTSSDRL